MVARALKANGNTCDEDTWAEVMAQEAVRTIRAAGRLTKGDDEDDR